MLDETNYEKLDEANFIDCENALLGILMSHPRRISYVKPYLKKDAFYLECNQSLYGLLLEKEEKGLPLDPKQVVIELPNDCYQNSQQKAQHIADCLGSFVSELNAVSYAKTITGAYLRRQIREISNSTMGETEKARNISEIWKEIATAETPEGVISLQGALERTFNKIGDNYRSGGGISGVKTGLLDLDHKLCGLDPSGLYVIAGRPAMGKTALAITIALNMALQKKHVIFVSLEMSEEQLMHRINARFSSNSIFDQKISRNVDFSGLLQVKSDLSTAPLTIIDKGAVTAEWISAKAKELSRSNNIDVIMIDHLGIVAPRDLKVTNRTQQLSEMTATFKALAKELRCPVVLLHQLNRGVESRDDKRPTLSDLRDSGSIEQDADAVMMIYREEYYLQNKKIDDDPNQFTKHMAKLERSKGIAEIIVAKNRQGETGIIPVVFNARKQEFSNLAQNA